MMTSYSYQFTWIYYMLHFICSSTLCCHNLNFSKTHYSLWIIHANDLFKITDSFSKDELWVIGPFTQSIRSKHWFIEYVLLGDSDQILAWLWKYFHWWSNNRQGNWQFKMSCNSILTLFSELLYKNIVLEIARWFECHILNKWRLRHKLSGM